MATRLQPSSPSSRASQSSMTEVYLSSPARAGHQQGGHRRQGRARDLPRMGGGSSHADRAEEVTYPRDACRIGHGPAIGASPAAKLEFHIASAFRRSGASD